MAKTFHVLRDDREKSSAWYFPRGGTCEGTTVKRLPTGDYTIKGHEDDFVIERKYTTGELAGNITQKRFIRELERLDDYVSPFLICEFTMYDVLHFPVGSHIPQNTWSKLRVTSDFLLKRILEFQVKYKTKWIFAGSDGFRVAWSLFKRILEK